LIDRGTAMEIQMQINGAAVRALREKKSWSQEHLSDAAGLSVRTVQRVEVENIASAETRLALAAALDVPVVVLIPASPSTSAPGGDHAPPLARATGVSFMRKTLLGVGLVLAFAVALLVLFNVLSTFLPRQP
jgi:transcriptional regulator with XRE-family HTH domain